MKKIMVILTTVVIGTTSYAQDAGYASNGTVSHDPFFTFNYVGEPKEIRTLGTNPEFPFLKDLSSTTQVYRAIKKHAGNNMLNDIIVSIGFSYGIQDLKESDISSATLPDGTTGNMGAGNGIIGYYKLVGDNGFKAWKITGDNGSYVYFLQACGNEFYPNAGKVGGTACVTAPVNVTALPTEITANGQQTQITNKVFVYYHMKSHRHMGEYANSEITDNNPSKPLLLNTTVKSELVPETYQVTISTPDQNITVCPDSTASVAANINIEKTSTYTGYYPNKTENQYKMVTRREYMKAERKMRKAERKEEKVARITKTPVETMETPATKS